MDFRRLQAVKANDLIPGFILNFSGQTNVYFLEALSETQQARNMHRLFSFPSRVYDIPILSRTFKLVIF